MSKSSLFISCAPKRLHHKVQNQTIGLPEYWGSRESLCDLIDPDQDKDTRIQDEMRAGMTGSETGGKFGYKLFM